jgi:hypothetical protein
MSDGSVQAIIHRPNEHFAPPLGTPDDVVHNKVYAVLLMLIVDIE